MLLTAVADLPEDGEDFMKNRSKSAGAIMKQVDFMVMMGSLGANPPPSILVRGPLFVGCRKFKNDLSRPKITVDHYQEWQEKPWIGCATVCTSDSSILSLNGLKREISRFGADI